jgi:hypothetical protein
MEILGTLMQAAGIKFRYRQWVLRQAQALDLPPNDKFLHHCETGLAWAKKRIVEAVRSWILLFTSSHKKLSPLPLEKTNKQTIVIQACTCIVQSFLRPWELMKCF